MNSSDAFFSDTYKNTLILIPAYNEQDSIGAVIDDIRKSLPGASIVVVNDGSSDHTEKVARGKDVHVLSHDVNLGIGATVQTGLKFARQYGYEIVVQVDGDGQHEPADLPRVIMPLIRNEVDMCIGSRFLGASVFLSTFSRRIGITFFSCLNFLLTGKWISDPTSGFRAMNSDVVNFFSEHYPADYPEPEVLVTLYKKGLRVGEVPVVMKPRTTGVSSISLHRAVYYMFKVTFSMIMDVFRTLEVSSV